MEIQDRPKQIEYLKSKIIKNIKEEKKKEDVKLYDIIKYIYINFKKEGYVFHAANSKSVEEKMKLGLRNDVFEDFHRKEIMEIEKIYRKYDSLGKYSPLGFGPSDIKNNKIGWFFDGFPIHSTTYANSPQWFSYFCGKSYVYFDFVSEENRNSYENKDYYKALLAIVTLLKQHNMNIADRKKILCFFIQKWEEYKNTSPCLMFVPVNDIGINNILNIKTYFSEQGLEVLLNEVIDGKVFDIKNVCCKIVISPKSLSYVDLSTILPKVCIDMNSKKNKNINNNFEREK